MTDHPLRAANHRRLGRLLPHRQANGTQTPPCATACEQRPSFLIILMNEPAYPVLILLSKGYPDHPDRLSTRYSPVRHFTRPRRTFLVRLACVKHAASVRSEPGSNSPVIYPDQSLKLKLKKSRIGLLQINRRLSFPLNRLCIGPPYCCSVFKDQISAHHLRSEALRIAAVIAILTRLCFKVKLYFFAIIFLFFSHPDFKVKSAVNVEAVRCGSPL